MKVGTPPPDGWEIGSTEILPPNLTVSGPASKMGNITEAETGPLDLSGLKGDSTLTAHAFISDSAVRFDGGSRVTVRVKLRRKE